MGYSGHIRLLVLKSCISLKLKLSPSTMVPYTEFDRQSKEYHGNKPSGECNLAHSSTHEGHYIFPSGRSSTAVCAVVVQGICTIIRDHDTLKRTSS